MNTYFSQHKQKSGHAYSTYTAVCTYSKMHAFTVKMALIDIFPLLKKRKKFNLKGQ